MTKPRLLDLFCCGGGATKGYQRAGFFVVGVDIEPQPNYCGDEFVQADVMEVLADYDAMPGWIGSFDAVHASPPCQAYSTISRNDKQYSDLYAPTRAALTAIGLPWVIENVIGAPYRQGIVLCGSMFGMRVRRHRNFESSFLIMQPQCDHASQGRPWTITGNGGGHESKHSKKPPRSEFPDFMDMPWASPYEASQAIPPAYTEWIGARLLEQIGLTDP